MAFQGDSIFWVEVEKIVPNPFQPRREFDEQKLKELAESVRMYGILQPLTVTRKEIQNEDGSFRNEYELIAGERRLRASKMAGVSQVPVIIREGEQSEQEKLELAIIENLQREDLNAVDRAIAFRQLADVFGLSHMQVAKKMGRSREYVSNSIRLLALPDYMLTALRMGDISEGHCRALLMLNDRPEEQDTVFRETLLKKLSVRDVERISRGIATEKMRKRNDYDADLLEMEKKFTETLGTRVSITKTDFGGRLSIDYFTQEELEEILEGMRREAKKLSASAVVASGVVTSIGITQVSDQPEHARVEELAQLTERTGLELVPESKPLYTPATMPEPEYIHQVASVHEQRELPVVPAVMSGYEIDTVVPSSPETAWAEPTEIPVPQLVTSAEKTYPETPVAHIITTAEPQFEPAPVPTTSESTIVVAPNAPSNSLRDQLASLLGKTNVVSTPVVSPVTPVQGAPYAIPTPVATPAPVAPVYAVPAPQPATVPSVQPISRVDTAPAPTVVSDESDLYSIRDFSI